MSSPSSTAADQLLASSGWRAAPLYDEDGVCSALVDEQGEVRYVAVVDIRQHRRDKYWYHDVPLEWVSTGRRYAARMGVPVLLVVKWSDGWGRCELAEGEEVASRAVRRENLRLFVRVPLPRLKPRPGEGMSPGREGRSADTEGR